MADTRTHIVGELYETEKSYVESLDILVNKYMRPLKSDEIIDSSVVDEIFHQIPEILRSHEYFLDLLTERLKDWNSSHNIGDLFVDCFTHQPMSEIYTAFINNWTHAKESIRIASSSKNSFRSFLDTASREHKGKLTLDALLIMPVQRIPRYELLIKELLKHTDPKHSDYQLLITAQNQIHELALKIDAVDEESKQLEKTLNKIREIESLIERSREIELASPDRYFIRYDFVTIPGGLGTKKERCLFLFSDLLLITSIKRKSGVSRKASAVASFGSSSSSSSMQHTLEGNKFKLLSSGKLMLENVDCIKGNDALLKKTLKDIESLQEDISIVNCIVKQTASLTTPHQALDDSLKELLTQLNKQLYEKQNNDSQLLTLEITITSQDGVDSLTLIFPSAGKRAAFETALFEAKFKLLESENRKPPPEFVNAIPVRKMTRSGLQFTCASATTGSLGHRDIWVCNSDGFLGQVYLLTLTPQPKIVSCHGVCESRILCIASIPGSIPTSKEKVINRPVFEESFESTDLRVSTTTCPVSSSQLLSTNTSSSSSASECTSVTATTSTTAAATATTTSSSCNIVTSPSSEGPVSPTRVKVASSSSSSTTSTVSSTSTANISSITSASASTCSSDTMISKKPMNQFNLDSDSSSDDDDTINSLEETSTTLTTTCTCPLASHVNLCKCKGTCSSLSSSSPTSSSVSTVVNSESSTAASACGHKFKSLEYQSTSLQSINIDSTHQSNQFYQTSLLTSSPHSRSTDIVTSSSSPCIPSSGSLFPLVTTASSTTSEVQSVSSCTSTTGVTSPQRITTCRFSALSPFSSTNQLQQQQQQQQQQESSSSPLASPKLCSFQMMSQDASMESDVESTASSSNTCHGSSNYCPAACNATMWLGTEDGCIHVFNSTDGIRLKKNNIKIQLSATVNSIVYYKEKVYSGLSNGQIYIFKRDNELGTWNTCDPFVLDLSNSSVLQLLPVSGKIWCAVQRYVKILNPLTLEVELSFHVSLDVTRVIHNMVVSGFGVWISTLASPVIRLYHATTYECLLDVNVAPAVSKVLSNCDDIIRQHKTACLRVTSLLACKDLLFIGSSAGVILTLPLPLLTPHTSKLDAPTVTGVSKGHTGHVRFLMSVEVSNTTDDTTCCTHSNPHASPLQYFRNLHHHHHHPHHPSHHLHHHHYSSCKQQQQQQQQQQQSPVVSLKHITKYPSSGTSTPCSVGSPPSIGITVPTNANTPATPVTSSSSSSNTFSHNICTFSQQLSPPFSSCNSNIHAASTSSSTSSFASSSSSSSSSKILVISGGDGFEKFTSSISSSSSTSSPVSESTGIDDSTNHLLIWSM